MCAGIVLQRSTGGIETKKRSLFSQEWEWHGGWGRCPAANHMSRERHSLRKLMYTLDKVGTLKKPRMGLKEWVMCSAGKWCSRGMKLVAEEYMAKQGRASAALLLMTNMGHILQVTGALWGWKQGRTHPPHAPSPRCLCPDALHCLPPAVIFNFDDTQGDQGALDKSELDSERPWPGHSTLTFSCLSLVKWAKKSSNM